MTIAAAYHTTQFAAPPDLVLLLHTLQSQLVWDVCCEENGKGAACALLNCPLACLGLEKVLNQPSECEQEDSAVAPPLAQRDASRSHAARTCDSQTCLEASPWCSCSAHPS